MLQCLGVTLARRHCNTRVMPYCNTRMVLQHMRVACCSASLQEKNTATHACCSNTRVLHVAVSHCKSAALQHAGVAVPHSKPDPNASHHKHHSESDNSVCCSVLQCVAVCCRVLQCVAVCCSTSLQHPVGRTARSVEDETRNDHRNAERNPNGIKKLPFYVSFQIFK